MGNERRPSWVFGTVALVIVAAALLRVAAADGDLGIDEVWSIGIATKLAHPWDALGVAHDNNHVLNTMWMSWLGPTRGELAYRAPSALAGTATVGFAAVIALAHGGLAAVVTAGLFCVSTLLLNAATEARGYALGLAMIALALWLVERAETAPRSRWRPLVFGCTIVVALLSHLSMVSAYGALLAYWLMLHVRRAYRAAPHELLSDAVRWHALPVAAIALLYWALVRRLKIGGGTPSDPVDTFQQTCAVFLGLPIDAPSLALATAVTVALCVLAVVDLYRRGNPRWLLCVAGLGLPVLLLFGYSTGHTAPRYLLVSVFFALLALGAWLASLLAQAGVRRVLGVSVLAVVLSLNALGDAELVRYGRGGYSKAVAFMLAHSEPGVVTLGSDHDFRNRVLLAHYLRRHPQGQRVAYVSQNSSPKEGTQWLILHRPYGDGRPYDEALTVHGLHYTRMLVLPAAALSGIGCAVYRRR